MCARRNVRIISAIFNHGTAHCSFTSPDICDFSMIPNPFWRLDLYLIFYFPVISIYAAAFAAAAAQLPVVNP